MQQKKILLIVAHKGFQSVEYNEIKKIVYDAGFTVVTGSNKSGIAIATDDSTTTVDIVLKDVNTDQYQGIFFIGGSGALEHLDNEVSYKIIKKAYAKQILLGSICIASRILAHSGILKGKKATGWNGDGELADMYQVYGVDYLQQDIVVDNLIITASGPDIAKEFGERIIAVLQDRQAWG